MLIWKDRARLIAAVSKAKTWGHALQNLGFCPLASVPKRQLKEACAKMKISTAHLREY